MKQTKPDNDDLAGLDELEQDLSMALDLVQVGRQNAGRLDPIYPAIMAAAEKWFQFRRQKEALRK